MVDIAVNRAPVDSSNLVAVGWEPDENDDQQGTLEVEFRLGVVYQYGGVPQYVYQGLLFAPSPGRFFRANVHEVYDGQRIE
ncbi:MAG TPA: KTSC domain-containing protein [Steroidobacteraceae bacterium]